MIFKIISLSLQHNNKDKAKDKMKYNELERKLKKLGCYDTGQQMAGHPIWHSPITGKDFKMSNHGSEEVATGTLKSIKRAAGLI